MYSLNNLKKLRQQTGISFNLCKKALEQSDDHIEKAKEILKKMGVEISSKKAERITNYGSLFSYLHHNKKVAAILELLCETDFVAINSNFQQLGQDLVMQVASMNPQNTKELLSQIFIKDSTKIVDNLIKECILKIGENIKVGRFIRWELGIS